MEKKTNDTEAYDLSPWLRWNVAVGRKAAGVYQQSNSAAERDPETH